MRNPIRPLCAARVLALVLAAVPLAAEARSLRTILGTASETVGLRGGSAFDALADTMADTAARSIPVVAASAGFTYSYNPELETFERTSQTLGPLFMERADTLGKGKFNVNVSFQYVNLNAFDGQDMGDLTNPDPIVTRVTSGGQTLGFTANSLKYDIGLRDYVWGFSFTYGILDNLDVNLLVPLIYTELDVGVQTQQLFAAGPDGQFTPSQGPLLTGNTGGNNFGVGDILLRFKYQLPRWGWLQSASGLTLRMPSGRKDEFQGTGSFEATPSIILSTVLWDRVTTYFNTGIDFVADDVDRSQALYAIGADVDLHPRVGFALAFIGRSEFNESAAPSQTSFLSLRPSGRLVQEPLLGLDFDRKDYLDLSFGFRVVVWKQLMLFVNGIYAVTDEGLRNSSVIPAGGIEGTF
ncbi:MAG: hypothetical protein KIT14_06775 [bacterium]|nr:hypothetical protein [bacterium]